MTVHVISVGLSVRDALRDPYRSFRDKRELARVIVDEKPDELLEDVGVHKDKAGASAWLAGALALPGDPSHDARAAERLAAMAQAIRPGQWPRDVSAEVATFAGMPGARLPLPAEDIAVMVCSDTPAGLLAGLWDAAALTDGDLGRLRYLAAPDALPGPVRGCAMLVRVPGLDAGDERGFGQAMGGLGTLGRNLLRSGALRDGEAFRFYLSGGFKAAIPYLIGLAEGLRSVDPGHPVDAFVRHETAQDGAPPIRLPLRRLIAEQVEEELSGYDSAGVRKGVPATALLNGYAYEVSGTRCTLTAFGEGLRALFGVTPEGFGG